MCFILTHFVMAKEVFGADEHQQSEGANRRGKTADLILRI